MWKKKLSALLLCMPLLFTEAYAAEERPEFDIQAQYEASGAAALYDELPDETNEYLKSIGLDGAAYDELAQVSVGDVLRSLLEMTRTEMKTPLSAAGLIMALLLLASFFKGGETALQSPLSPSLGTVTAVAVSVTVAAPLVAMIGQITDTVQAACTFAESFAAVFAAVLLANGQAVSAAGYSTFLLGAIELSNVCVGELIVPMMKIFLALSCVSSVSDGIHIESIIGFFEKNAKWLLSFLAFLISTILGISGIISASADNLAARTAKFVISGSVPVVGGAMSDAYLSVKSGMALLRNSVGAFGIIAIAYLYLPLILRTVLWNLVMEGGVSVCETLQLDHIGKLMKSLAGMMSLLIGVLVFSMFLLILGSVIVIMQQSS